MDEGSQIQQESDVSEVPIVTPHTSPGHSGRDDGKTGNNKDGYQGRSQSPTKGNFSPSKKRKHPKKTRRERGKEGILLPHQLPVQHQTVIHVTMNQRSRFKVVPEDEWYKYKILKSMASFANEHFELYLPDKKLHSNILKENPVHDNADQVKKLDDFAISILKDRRGSASNGLINQVKVLEKIQVNIRDIMGPLVNFGTLWRKP